MPFLLEQPQRTLCPAYLSFEPIFASEQAYAIIQEYGTHMTVAPSEGSLRHDFAMVRWSKQAAWIFRALGQAVDRARSHAFPFSFSGFAEPLHLMRFTGEKGHGQDWAMECGRGSRSTRKLTLTVELSNAGAYVGGGMEVHGPEGVRRTCGLKLGEVTCWPSYAVHRTLPVTKGVRWALRAHLSGPAFV